MPQTRRNTGKFWRWGLLAGVGSLLFLLAACAGGGGVTPTPGGLSGAFQVKGSDTMVNLASAQAEAFMAKNSRVSIAVTGGGSGTGIAALINKNTDLANASRPMTAEEIKKAQDNGVNPQEVRVALDGLAVAVNPSNPVSELTFEQLAAIYQGKITNWKEVGGPDAPMVVLSRDTNSGTHVFFKEHVVQFNDAKAEYGPNVQMMAASKTGVDQVVANSNAIFYVGMGYITDKVKVLAIRETKDSPAVKPSMDTVLNGSYKVSRPLFVYTNGEPSGVIKAYLDWILGPEGQNIVVELDFVPLK